MSKKTESKNIKKKIFKLPKVDVKKAISKQKYFFPVLVFVVLLGSLYLARGLFISATVNGKLIFRSTIVKTLEKQYGKTTLEAEIEKALITQEAKKANVVITQDDVNTEIVRIEDLLKQQGTDLDTALSYQGQTRDDLKNQILAQKQIEAILGSKVSVSEEEVSDYFTENKDYFGDDAQLEDFQEDIYNQLFQQKLITEYNSWISDLKTASKIKYIVNY